MTKVEAVAIFRKDWVSACLRNLRLKTDRVAHNEAWGNFTDSLCKSGQITERQYMTWDNPPMPKRFPKEAKDYNW